jgi:hypothetical protein
VPSFCFSNGQILSYLLLFFVIKSQKLSARLRAYRSFTGQRQQASWR